MNLNKKLLLLSCLSFFLLFSSTIVGTAKIEKTIEEDTKITKSSVVETRYFPSLSYEIRGAIEIGSDIEFDASHGVSAGSGTALDPYIIEGWNITVLSGQGIYIHDTTAFFIIRNCWIDAGTGVSYPDYDSSIYLDTIADGTATIENNTCLSSFAGISLYMSNFSLLIDNICELNSMGIKLEFANNNSVISNTCNSNNYGITVGHSEYNFLSDNNCSTNNWHGFNVYSSSNFNSFVNNFCTSNVHHGFYLTIAHNNTLENNFCDLNGEAGIYMDASLSNLVINNVATSNFNGIYLVSSELNSLISNICNLNSFGGIQEQDRSRQM